MSKQTELLKVESWPVEKVVPYARNPRKNDGVPVAKVKASLKEFGWRQPIVVDSEGVIIVGHTRYQAALELGMTEIPVHVAEGLTAAQVKAYRIADNKTGDFAEWDFDLLKLEFADLQELDFGLDLTGFDDDAIDGIMVDSTPEGLTDPDEVPDVPDEPVSKPGDVWVMGNHRLMCGDSTVATDVERLLGNVKPHLMVTDPPYGVEYDPSWRNGLDAAKNRRTGVVENDGRADWRDAWALFPGSIAYVWHGGLHAAVVAESLTACGFSLRAQIVWAKQKMVFGRGDYHWQHEPCWYAVKGTGSWCGDRKQTTIWTIDNLNLASHQKKENERTNHSTQKPAECMKRPIENNSSPGQAVYEPFSGSGTTIIAAEMTGRCCYAMELNPAYVDMAVKRWEDFTGKKAVLEESNAEG